MKRKLNIRAITTSIFVVSVIWILVTIFFVFSVKKVSDIQDRTFSLTNDYIFFSDRMTELSYGSTTLTENARKYISTGNPAFLRDYSEVAAPVKERTSPQNSSTPDTVQASYDEYLKKISGISNSLKLNEFRALKLAVLAYNEDDSILPQEIRDFTLSDEDKSLSREQQLSTARELLDGENYNQIRAQMLTESNDYFKESLNASVEEYRLAEDELNGTLLAERIFLIVEALSLGVLILLIKLMASDRKQATESQLRSATINASFTRSYDIVSIIDLNRDNMSVHDHSDIFTPEMCEQAQNGFSFYVNYLVNNMVLPDDIKYFEKMISPSAIREAVRDNNVYSFTFRIKSSSNDKHGIYYKFKFLQYTDSEGHDLILHSAASADTEIRAGLKTEINAALVESLATIVESRDVLTGDHVRNTRHYVGLIVEELKNVEKYTEVLNNAYSDNIISGSVLHDIGKIYISDTILNKPGKLTHDEFESMKKHTVLGSKVIKNTFTGNIDEETQSIINNIVLYHHERWDGKGYPYGISGDSIPLSARIMAVADVFDALVSQRSYKKSFSVSEAYDIIEDESGTHFDSDIVDAFIRVRPMVEEFLA